MSIVTVVEYRGALHSSGCTVVPVPILPEAKVTAVDATSAATIVLQSETTIVEVSASAAARMSGRGAISGSNLGIPIPTDGNVRQFAAIGGSTLYMVAGA